MSRLHTILVRPLETEKSVHGNAKGIYTFIVRRDATKTEVKQAIKKYYNVDVQQIRTSVIAPKTRLVGRGRTLIKRPLSKKAIITTVGTKPIDVNQIIINK